MKYCSKCGAKLDEDAKFCNECGTKLVEKTVYATAQPINQGPKTNGFAVASFVISLVSILCCGYFSGAALIFSIVGLVQTNKTGDKGKGLAIAGIILSAVGIIFAIGFSMLGYATEIIDEIGTSAFIL